MLIRGIFLTVLIASGVSFAQQKSKAPATTSIVPSSIATVETSLGTFEMELLTNEAPKTVENFTRLVEKKYFDGTHVHRISRTEGVIQMGDEKSKDTSKVKEWGTGGRSASGREFADELNLNSTVYKQGYRKSVVAMANRGPNTNASQFFIMLRDMPYKPKNYTIFGRVIKGQSVVDRIGQLDIVPQLSSDDGRPKVHVQIRKVTIREQESPADQTKQK